MRIIFKRIEKYQVKRTEEYEGGRQKITETRYRILDNEGKVIDDAQGTATNPPRRRESPTGIRSAVGEKQKTQERTARNWLAKHPGIKRAYLDLVDRQCKTARPRGNHREGNLRRSGTTRTATEKRQTKLRSTGFVSFLAKRHINGYARTASIYEGENWELGRHVSVHFARSGFSSVNCPVR